MCFLTDTTSNKLVKVPVMRQVLQVGRVILELVWQTDKKKEKKEPIT